MEDFDWNERIKRLLKSELVKRGITNEELVDLLEAIGVQETKISIDSKISRGTFSAAFFLQCLNAIGCKNLFVEIETLSMVEEPQAIYRTKKQSIKKIRK